MWNVPVDHSMFDDISSTQWMWYFHNFLKDQDEDFTTNRDFVEYHASFIEPQAVHKIRESRNKAIAVDDNTFAQTVSNVFGRSLPGAKSGIEATESHSINMGEIMNNIKASRVKPKDPSLNYKYWSQIKLE